MEYRTLGKTGFQVSEISMGTWALGGQWGELDEDVATATVHAALDAGVNFFDVADGYGPLVAEQRLGAALKGRRQDVFISTKLGNFLRRHGHHARYTHPLHIINSVHAALYRLQTDYIDVLLCHQADPEDSDLFVESFEQLVEQGLIRAYGISTMNTGVIEKFDRTGNCGVVQIDYSIVRRGPEASALKTCAERNIGTQIRGGLGQGVLTGSYNRDSRFTDSVRSSWNEGERHELFLREIAAAEEVKKLVTPERSMVDVALAFVLAHPAVSCAIPGMKSPDQARANVAAAAVQLTDDEMATIREASAGFL
jgi:aryl-alcohol dehydrogenase-like predicted oxidoreductase